MCLVPDLSKEDDAQCFRILGQKQLEITMETRTTTDLPRPLLVSWFDAETHAHGWAGLGLAGGAEWPKNNYSFRSGGDFAYSGQKSGTRIDRK